MLTCVQEYGEMKNTNTGHTKPMRTKRDPTWEYIHGRQTEQRRSDHQQRTGPCIPKHDISTEYKSTKTIKQQHRPCSSEDRSYYRREGKTSKEEDH